MASADLVDYYRRRAAEYEAIYRKPERQHDLGVLRKTIAEAVRGARVLEVACGTGYWTELISHTAAQVVATDLAPEPLAIARAKPYARRPRFMLADAYALPGEAGRFDAALALFWWSHVPRQRIEEFLASLHGCLECGARVVLMDNRYVEGSSTAISPMDAHGNTYQLRRLADGSEVRVLKNFPGADELRAQLPAPLDLELLEYYWLAQYRLP